MALATYSDLLAAVANRASRTNMTATIPDYVAIAELRLTRLLEAYELASVDSFSTVSGTALYALPSDFLASKVIRVSDGSQVTLIDRYVDQVSMSYTGIPRYWTLEQGQLSLFPTPDAVYAVTHEYTAKPSPLSVSNTTNWYLTHAPDALLYGALRELYMVLNNSSKVAEYESLFTKAITELRKSNKRGQYPAAGVHAVLR